MTLDIKIDGESVLLHDNAATVIYALRVLVSVDEFERVHKALRWMIEETWGELPSETKHHPRGNNGCVLTNDGEAVDYDLKKPCAKCPFRTDCLEGWLGRKRATDIADGIIRQQGTFPCHETVDYSEGEDPPNKQEQHCAGALILLEKLKQPNQMMRICERLGIYDRKKLNMDSPVFDTPAEFIDHHTEPAKAKRKRKKGKPKCP